MKIPREYLQFVDAFMMSEDCNLYSNSHSIILLKCASILFKIMLNNYSKAQNDSVRYSTVIPKKSQILKPLLKVNQFLYIFTVYDYKEGFLNLLTFFNSYVSAVLFLPVHIDTKKRYKTDFVTIKQYLISIFPLTVKKSCLNFISLKR